MFNDHVSDRQSHGSALVGKKLKDVMAPTTAERPWAWPNRSSPRTSMSAAWTYPFAPLLTQITVKASGTITARTAVYSPRTGATWTYDEIVAYLKTTMHSAQDRTPR